MRLDPTTYVPPCIFERPERVAHLFALNRGNAVSVPNFNRATRPAFGPGSDPNPPVDVGDGFLMKRGWTVAMSILPYERSSCFWQRIAYLYRRLEQVLEVAPDEVRILLEGPAAL